MTKKTKAAQTKPRETRGMREFTLAMVKSRCTEDGGCWLWQQSCNSTGYPQASINGKPTLVRRWVLEQKLGRKIRHGHTAVAQCGCKTCVSPECAVERSFSVVNKQTWASGAQRQTQARIDSRIANTSKALYPIVMTMAKARELRRRFVCGESLDQLAAAFGITRRNARDIANGRAWKEPMAPASVFHLGSMLAANDSNRRRA